MNACYPENVFKDFLSERLNEPDASQLSDHLANCAACQSQLDFLSDDEELSSWKTCLKHAQTKQFSSTIPDPLLARLREIPRFQTAPREKKGDEKGEHSQFLPTDPMRLSDTGTELAGDREGEAGLRVGQYEIVREVGRGGMGVVYEARHSVLKNRVALKVIAPKRLEDADSLSRFHREMEAVGKLSHANIIKATDAQSERECFLVMEYVDGSDLGAVVGAVGALKVADACEIVRQAALGLEHVCEHGLIHRDVKPSNLLLGRDGVVKVTDLGLARLHDSHSPEHFVTSTGHVTGTVDYIAPEQAYDTRNADIRSDLYALGGTLFHLLTGRPLFEGDAYDTPMKKLMAHIHDAPPPVSSCRQNVPKDIAAIVFRLLAKDPEERFQTPAELARAIEPFCEGADLRQLAKQAAANRDDCFEVGSMDQTPALSSPGLDTTFARPLPERAERKPPPRGRTSLRGFGVIGGGVLLAGAAVAVAMTLIPVDRAEPVANAHAKAKTADEASLAAPVVMDWRKRFPPREGNPVRRDDNGTIMVTPEKKDAWIKLGEFDHSIREVSIDMTQFVDWKGFFGLYFDPRADEFQRQPGVRFQMIRFFRESPKVGGQLVVRWGDVLLSLEPGRFEIPKPSFTSPRRFRARSPGETVTLTLRFNGGVIDEVLLNGETVRFVDPDRNPVDPNQFFRKIPDGSPWGCYTADAQVVKYSKPTIIK